MVSKALQRRVVTPVSLFLVTGDLVLSKVWMSGGGETGLVGGGLLGGIETSIISSFWLLCRRELFLILFVGDQNLTRSDVR